MDNTYVTYVMSDTENRITAINSNAFLLDTDGWTEIDRGSGDKYLHAQGHYFPHPIYTNDGICRYKLENGTAMERTPEEIAADMVRLINS